MTRVTETEINNLQHRMNLDRDDIKDLPEGHTIAVNITTHRQAADIIKRLWEDITEREHSSKKLHQNPASSQNITDREQFTMPDGRPIFGPGSPHNIGKHFDELRADSHGTPQAALAAGLAAIHKYRRETTVKEYTLEGEYTAGFRAYEAARGAEQPDEATFEGLATLLAGVHNPYIAANLATSYLSQKGWLRTTVRESGTQKEEFCPSCGGNNEHHY